MGQFSAGSETILTRQSKNLVGNIILIGGLSMLAAALILSWLNSRFITPANRPAPQLSNPRNANTAKPETNIRDTEALTEFYGNATSFVNVLRADCLAENGFPQAREARTLTRPPAVTSHPVAYGFRRVDFGPDTPETAKYYGFGGLEVAQANEEVGSIESQSKGFDAAASRCERWITERSPNLSTAIAQASKLRDEIRNSYSTEISKRSRGDLAKLSTCIQRRFPDIDGNSLYESYDNYDKLLSGLGIHPGKMTSAIARDPITSETKTGKILIWPPANLSSYSPSEHEVAVALTFVECRSTTGFDAGLIKNSDLVADDIEVKWGGESKLAIETLQQALAKSSS